MAKTNADYRMIVKELPSGKNTSVWALECYPKTTEFPFISKSGSMYICLNSSTTEEEAKEICHLLNEHVKYFTIID